MGHRANFIVIRSGKASAYRDQWAALGCTYVFAEGPDRASTAAEASEPTSELMDWAFAEAGYLIDYDERVAFVFGYPQFDFDPDDPDASSSQEAAEYVEVAAALMRSPLDFLKQIAPRWAGWQLQWDDRGVDAFAVYLRDRGIRTSPLSPRPIQRAVKSSGSRLDDES